MARVVYNGYAIPLDSCLPKGLGGYVSQGGPWAYDPAKAPKIDPTNGIVGNADLVRVAIARDPRQAVPLHGTWAGEPGDYLDMDVTVDVRAETEAWAQPSLA